MPKKLVRKGDYDTWGGSENSIPPYGLNQLFDAACEVVNDFEHSAVRHAYIDKLAEALEPFTEEEGPFYSNDYGWIGYAPNGGASTPLAKLDSHIQAKDMRDALNRLWKEHGNG